MSYQQKRGKNKAWINGLIRNLATELIINGRLELTEMRAKKLRCHVDKLITLGKRQNLHARRCASGFLRDIDANEKETVLQKLFNGIAKKYKTRNGGYTRILKLDNRKGDNAPMVIIELV